MAVKGTGLEQDVGEVWARIVEMTGGKFKGYRGGGGKVGQDLVE